ncbi:MAG: hypothetical protein AB1705_03000 [Verrucomicrobiota bacterium]
MIAKYHVEYAVRFSKHEQVSHYQTDDPVACEQFLVELLERGLKIRDIKHDGVSLPRTDFDGLLKNAAGMLAAKHLCASLDMEPEEEHFRFGFAA